MKILAFTLALLTIGAALLSCASTDAGNRPLPTTAATTRAEPEPEPPAVAEIAWAICDYDPWFERDTAEPLLMGQLYYRLNPSLAQGQTVDENTRYVMSFTYITVDYNRFSLEDYLKNRGFQQHVYESDQEPSNYMLFDLTEEEIQTITPESVQAYYGLDALPAVVGIHRYMSKSGNMHKGYSHVNSEQFWYRTDLMWGVGYLSEDVKRKPVEVYFYAELEPAMAEVRGWSARRKCAVTVCIYGIDEGARDYFVSKGIEILPIQYADGRSADYFGQQVVIEIALGDLWKITLEDMEQFYGCELAVTCFLAVQPNDAEIVANLQ